MLRIRYFLGVPQSVHIFCFQTNKQTNKQTNALNSVNFGYRRALLSIDSTEQRLYTTNQRIDCLKKS